jgi:hypothetical protein
MRTGFFFSSAAHKLLKAKSGGPETEDSLILFGWVTIYESPLGVPGKAI